MVNNYQFPYSKIIREDGEVAPAADHNKQEHQVECLTDALGNYNFPAGSVEQRLTTLGSDNIAIQGDVATLQGDVATLQGDVATLQGDVATLDGLFPLVLDDLDDVDTTGALDGDVLAFSATAGWLATTASALTLAQTLAIGNITDGSNIIVSAADAITGEATAIGGPLMLLAGIGTDAVRHGSNVVIAASHAVGPLGYYGGTVTITGGDSPGGNGTGNVIIDAGSSPSGTRSNVLIGANGVGSQGVFIGGNHTNSRVTLGSPTPGSSGQINIFGSGAFLTFDTSIALRTATGAITLTGTAGPVTIDGHNTDSYFKSRDASLILQCLNNFGGPYDDSVILDGNGLVEINPIWGWEFFVGRAAYPTWTTFYSFAGTPDVKIYDGRIEAEFYSSLVDTADVCTVQSGNNSAGNSGNTVIDVGTASGTTGNVLIGGTSATAITVGRNGVTTTFTGTSTASITDGSINLDSGAHDYTMSIAGTNRFRLTKSGTTGTIDHIISDNSPTIVLKETQIARNSGHGAGGLYIWDETATQDADLLLYTAAGSNGVHLSPGAANGTLVIGTGSGAADGVVAPGSIKLEDNSDSTMWRIGANQIGFGTGGALPVASLFAEWYFGGNTGSQETALGRDLEMATGVQIMWSDGAYPEADPWTSTTNDTFMGKSAPGEVYIGATAVTPDGTLQVAMVSSGSDLGTALMVKSGDNSAGNSGALDLDVGTASGTTGNVNLGGANATAIFIGHVGIAGGVQIIDAQEVYVNTTSDGGGDGVLMVATVSSGNDLGTDLVVKSGDHSAGNSGNLDLDIGTASGSVGSILLGTVNAELMQIGHAGAGFAGGLQIVNQTFVDINSTLDGAGDGTLQVATVQSDGAMADLTFGARGSTIVLNEAGDESLSTTSFAATSIIGALNELIGIATAGIGTLSQVLAVGNTTGGTSIEGEPGSASTGGVLTLKAGDGTTGFAGGASSLLGGDGATTGAGGKVDVIAGTGGATNGTGGALNLKGGIAGATTGEGGTVLVMGGNGATTGAGGTVSIRGGSSPSGADGSVNIGLSTTAAVNIAGASSAASVAIGNSANAGAVTIQGESITATANDGTAAVGGALALKAGDGASTFAGGASSLLGGDGATTGAGGSATITGGNGGSSNAAGGANLISGGAGGGTTGQGGLIYITGGAAKTNAAGGLVRLRGGNSPSGTHGAIVIGDENTSTVSIAAGTSATAVNIATGSATSAVNIGNALSGAVTIIGDSFSVETGTFTHVDPAGKATNARTSSSETLDVSTTEVTTGLIPAGAYDIAVVVRNTSTLTATSAVSYDVGIDSGGDIDEFGTTRPFTNENSTTSANWTAVTNTGWSASAREIRVTPNVADFLTGTIQVVAFYTLITAQTED